MGRSLFVHAPAIVFSLAFDALYFVPWWYSRGLAAFVRRAYARWRRYEEELAIGVWLKHLFKPLTDDYGWRGRTWSAAKRLVIVSGRMVVLAFWTAGELGLVALYAVLPVLAAWQIIYQIVTL